jgi:hypothetical protein
MVSLSRISPTKNHFGSLAQRRPQSEGKAGRIAVQLTLMNDAVLVAVEKLDGILDREHVIKLLFVDLVDDGRQGRGFAGAGRSGHQYDSIAQTRRSCSIRTASGAIPGREPYCRNHPHHDGTGTTLHKTLTRNRLAPGIL